MVLLEAGNRQILLANPLLIFTDFLGKHAPQTSVGKSHLTAPFLPLPPTSQNQPLTKNLLKPLILHTVVILSILTWEERTEKLTTSERCWLHTCRFGGLIHLKLDSYKYLK